MMLSFALLGLLTGMGHALEADHLAAMATMAADKQPHGKRKMAWRGAVWGMGHSLTIFIICGAVILLGVNLQPELAAAMEFSVGIMLVVLGLDVVRRFYKQKLHFHGHDHGDGQQHIHVHSHLGSDTPHHKDPHDHKHPEKFPVKAFIIGLIHGAGGSAGLLVLALAATQSVAMMFYYMLSFGLGSIIGMAAISMAASWPLERIGPALGKAHFVLNFAIAAISITIGATIMIENYAPAFAGALGGGHA